MKKLFILISLSLFINANANAESEIEKFQKTAKRYLKEAATACHNPVTDRDRIHCLEKQVRFLAFQADLDYQQYENTLTILKVGCYSDDLTNCRQSN